MLMLIILVLGAAYLLLTKLESADPRQARALDASQTLADIRDALIGYALVNNGCLPCPSTNPVSGVAPASCNAGSRAGYLPWESLNLGALNRWNHRYRYSVDPAFANPGCSGLTLSSSGDIEIRTRNSGGALVTLFSNQPALVLSHGPNGYGARNADGSALPNPPPGHVDEQSNRSAVTQFVQRPASDDGSSAGGPFDDQLSWVPLNVLLSQVDKAKTPPGLPP